MSRALQATTNNVKIYSYNSPLGLTGKVFVLVNINDGENIHRSTGQSAWNVLSNKNILLRELNNAILDSVNNYLHDMGESPNIFYRQHKNYVHSDKLLKDMTDDYGITVTLRAYKIMYQTDKYNSLSLSRKRKFVRIKRNNHVIKRYEYRRVYKHDIKQSFNEQTNVDVETAHRFENKELSMNIKEIYRQKKGDVYA